MNEHKSPCRGVVWHKRQKRWRVRVKKMDRTVNPARVREFYHEFKDVETAIRVRDYVSIMLHGRNARHLQTDGRLPPGVTPLHIIEWGVKQGTFTPQEVSHFMGRVKHLDKPGKAG